MPQKIMKVFLEAFPKSMILSEPKVRAYFLVQLRIYALAMTHALCWWYRPVLCSLIYNWSVKKLSSSQIRQINDRSPFIVVSGSISSPESWIQIQINLIVGPWSRALQNILLNVNYILKDPTFSCNIDRIIMILFHFNFFVEKFFIFVSDESPSKSI